MKSILLSCFIFWSIILWIGFLISCNRNYDGNPYLTSSDTLFTADNNNNGIADSVEKYFPNCKLIPKICLDSAMAIKNAIPPSKMKLDSVRAENLYLIVGHV